MNKLYFIVMFVCCIFGAFAFGKNIADAKCRLRFAQTINKQTEQYLENKRIINDKVYKTGVADIRHILQSEYSISE